MRLNLWIATLSALTLTSCTRTPSRQPAAELPPAKIENLPVAKNDQPPIVRTATGFVPTTLPGVSPSPSPEPEIIHYRGPSN